MKSIHEASTRQELIRRINSLTPESKAQWGKMNVYQMVKHCTHCEEMYHGEIKIKRVFIGRLIGKFVLKGFIKDERPLSKGSPTADILVIKQKEGDFERQKQDWIKRIEQYADFRNLDFVHPFFGSMNKEQVGIMSYKHADHHLKQFGA